MVGETDGGRGGGEAGRQGGVEVFPNPVNGEILNITSEAGIKEVNINSISGCLVNSISFNLEKTVKMNISGLAPGIYFITVCSNEGVIDDAVIIRR